MKFTPEQIERLRAEFEQIQRIDPCCPKWSETIRAVGQMPSTLRCQLAAAGIRWLSSECERQQKSLHKIV